jgi:hypothetical protein
MATTYTELIYRIVSQAQRGSESEEQANLDAYSIAEAMVPSIFQATAEKAAGDPHKRSLLKRTKTMTFTNGLATVDTDVLVNYLCDATLLDSTALTKIYAWIPEYGEFVGFIDARLGSFNSPVEFKLAIREPGVAYSPSTGLTGSRLLNVPCVPEIPAGADDPLLVTDEIVNDLIDIGAEMLRGAMAKVAAATT